MDNMRDMPPGMPFDEIPPEEVRRVRGMSKEEIRAEILRLERFADENLPDGPEAWDMYFSLMHEAHMADFSEDFDRLRDKIDLKKYDPFKSKNIGVVFLARWRLNAALEAERK